MGLAQLPNIKLGAGTFRGRLSGYGSVCSGVGFVLQFFVRCRVGALLCNAGFP